MAAPRIMKTSLMIKLIIVAVVPILFVGTIALVYLYRDLKQDVARENQTLVRSIAGEVGGDVVEALNLMSHVGGVMERGEVLVEREIDFYLESEIRTTDLFESLLVLDEKGYVVHAGLAGHLKKQKNRYIGQDLSGLEVYRDTLKAGTNRWSNVLTSLVSGGPTLLITSPFNRGMVIGILNLQALSKIPQRIRSDGYAAAMIVTEDGGIIAHADTTMIGKKQHLDGLSPGKGGRIAMGEGGSNAQIWARPQGVVTIPENGWMVIVTQEFHEVYAPLRRLAWTCLAGLVLAIVLAVLAAISSKDLFTSKAFSPGVLPEKGPSDLFVPTGTASDPE